MRLEFDDAALRGEVDAAAVEAESARLRDADGGSRSSPLAQVARALGGVALVAGAWVLALVLVHGVFLLVRGGGGGLDPAAPVIAALMVGPFGFARIAGLIRGDDRSDEKRYRLRRFAGANGMTFTPVVDHPSSDVLPPSGRRAHATDVLRRAAPRALEVGQLHVDARVDPERRRRAHTYLVFGLEHAVTPSTLRIAHAAEDAASLGALVGPAFGADLLEVAGGFVDLDVAEGRVVALAPSELDLTDPRFWRWTADLAAVIDRHLAGGSDPRLAQRIRSDRRRADRAALFAREPVRNRLVTRLVLPLIGGIVAAALLAWIGA